MSKKKLCFIIIMTMIISCVGTIVVTTFFEIDINGRVIISKSEYEKYRDIRDEYGDLFELKDFLMENYYIPLDEEKLEEGMYKGLFEGADDPYTKYLTAEEYEEFRLSSMGELYGVGVTTYAGDDGYINVLSTVDDSPAEAAGIKTGDKIIKVDDVEYTAETLNDAVDVMRGEAGESVKITILRDDKEIEFDIIREKITLSSVESEIIEDEIGYISISSFNITTGEEFEKEYNEMKDNINGLIIDLRNNPGGIVDSAVEVCDLLMDKADLVYLEERSGEKETYTSKDGKINIPFVILVNENSASSSEIMAAAIKENNAGEIIGVKTYGKGIIQQVLGLEDGAAIEFTIAQYFSKNGNVIHEEGVEPDIVVELDLENLGEDGYIYDNQLEKAIEVVKEKI